MGIVIFCGLILVEHTFLQTGDLYTKSQHLLLEQYKGQWYEFVSDVAKSCHHGSDDCSYEFLATLRPSATVNSSGDNEGHGHPRSGIVAASALTGHTLVQNDEIVTPLIHSTEVARSYRIGDPFEILKENYSTADGSLDIRLTETHNPMIKTPKPLPVICNRINEVGG